VDESPWIHKNESTVVRRQQREKVRKSGEKNENKDRSKMITGQRGGCQETVHRKRG